MKDWLARWFFNHAKQILLPKSSIEIKVFIDFVIKIRALISTISKIQIIKVHSLNGILYLQLKLIIFIINTPHIFADIVDRLRAIYHYLQMLSLRMNRIAY